MAAFLPVVNEGSTHVVRVSFADENGASFAPEEVSVRLDNAANGAQVRGWTALAPGAEIDVEVTPAENAIADPDAEGEERVLTVRARWAGGSRQMFDEYRYVVRNLRFAP